MTLDDLRFFVAVCKAGSLSAVARDMSCTQSAVSQHVKRLERELGLSLLERHPRGVAPTQAGHLLRAAVEDGLGGIDRALREIEALVRGDGGSVRITTGATTVRHFMSDAIVEFRRRHPQVSLEFETENSTRRCFEALASGGVDLAWITIGAPVVRGIDQRTVVELPWALAVGADHPLAARASIAPGDLDGLAIVGLPGNSISRSHLDHWLQDAQVRPVLDSSVADWDTAILLAELGLGCAIVPALPGWLGPRHSGLRLVPIPALPVLSAGWAVRSWDALSPLARTFADTVARTCATRATPG
ncbi:LysR family transcriptional regulator [Streptomyces sp. NBC_00249]|uniref:LysR family transcriptional regulator n=1 Tax=Streptomyces sp. NBC_00249 TaxID=2975690 RepID=UPI002255B4C0|nr:LysR family transcriptional regulator [Streptomyces sp. NBC_00249]MCX5192500.1 LysR family transcriptional regulator [Streptomyces sp. NBC_00249]